VQLLKNTVLFIISMFFIFAFSSSSSALVLREVQILDGIYHTPINFMSTGNPALVELIFNYTLQEGESFDVSSVNALELYPTGIYSKSDYSDLQPDCKRVNDTTTFSCKIKALTLKTKNNTINITVSGIYTNSSGSIPIINSTTLKISIDNSNPGVSFLGTDKCNNNICYISSGEKNNIKIVMSDERATFDHANVGYKIGSKIEKVDICRGMTCNGSSTINCGDGEKIKLSITSTSRDDVGNRINLTSSELVCDASPPLIKEHSISSEIGPNTLVLNKDMIFEFNVTDVASPNLKIKIDANEVLGGNVTSQCTKTSVEGTGFICRGIVKPEIDLPGEYEFKISIEDMVGNVAKKSISVPLLKTTNETVNNWKVSSVSQSSNSFSRPNLQFERTLFVRVNLQPLGSTEIVSITPGGNCIAVEPNKTGLNSDIASVKLVSKQSSSIYLKVALKENSDARYDKLDNLSYLCPISIISKKGNYYFSTPEKDNFLINIDLKDDKNIQQLHEDEIDRITKKVENNLEKVSKLNKVVNTAETLCQTCGVAIPTISGTLGTIQTLLGSNQVTMGAALGLNAPINAVQSTAYEGFCKSIKPYCKYITCDREYVDKASNWMDSNVFGDSNIYNYLGYESASSSFNPYKSYVVALASACVPAALYHYNNYIGIQCTYLDCISNDYVQYGQDISTCMQDKQYSECVFFWGGALDAIPYVSMIRDVSTRLGNMMKDPLQLFGVVAPLACKALSSVPAAKGLCVSGQDFAQSVKGINELVQIANQISKIASSDKATTTCEATIANAKTREYYRLNKIGYSANFDPSVSKSINDNAGELNCEGSQCTYTKRLSNNNELVYNINVVNGKDVYIYSDNKLISSSNFNYDLDIEDQKKEINDMYDDQIKDLKQRADAGIITQVDYASRLTAIESSRQNDLKNVKHSSLTAEEFEKLKAEAKQASKESYNKLYAKYPDLKGQIESLQKKEDEYRNFMINEYQDKISNGNDDLKAAKEYSDLLEQRKNRNDNKLSESKESELKDLYAQFNPEFSTKYDEALKNVKMKEQELDRLRNQGGSMPAKEEAEIKDAENELTNARTRVYQLELERDAGLNSYEQRNLAKNKIIENEKEISELKALEKEKRKQRNKAETEVDFGQYFGTWSRTAMTSWGNAQMISGLRTVLNSNWLKFNPDGKFGFLVNAGDWLIEDAAQFEKAFCKSNIKPEQRMGDVVIMNSGGDSIFMTGAQIGGRKSGPVNDGKKTYYEYWVQGNVMTSKRDGLIVNIILVDSAGKEVDVTNKITGEDTNSVNKGIQFTFGRPSANYFTDSANYDKICMVFSGGSLNTFFDYVQGGNTDRICQKLIAE